MRHVIPVFFISLFILFSCNQNKSVKEKTEDKTVVENPCENPKTSAELLACASKYGEIIESKITTGKEFNGTNCLKSWNDQDTVLTISYKDSVNLWRVQPSPDTPTDVYGHWFTNINAKELGLTKAETVNLYALNNCSKFDWTTCVCNGHNLPPDSLIQYEELARIAPKHSLRFGVVGANEFGKGGNLQWHLMTKIQPPYTLIKQEKWD